VMAHLDFLHHRIIVTLILIAALGAIFLGLQGSDRNCSVSGRDLPGAEPDVVARWLL
jgi:hypothetical protein